MKGDVRYAELEKEAHEQAISVLTEKGAKPLTYGEALLLQLGIACGIQASINKFVGKDEKPTDYFAE